MYDEKEILNLLKHRRARNSPMAKFINATMPPDPEPLFVWPEAVVGTSRRHFRIRNLVIVSLILIVMTITTLLLLAQIPFLRQSIVNIMTIGFETFIPKGWATGAAWIVGLAGTVMIGSFVDHNSLQIRLLFIPATRSKAYNFILMAALLEEQVFRSGSEKWSWPERIRASIIFGAIHITNIWYSMAAGLALGLTGFGFLLVYHWYYRRTENDAIATAASTTVHAIYNLIALVIAIIVITGLIVTA